MRIHIHRTYNAEVLLVVVDHNKKWSPFLYVEPLIVGKLYPNLGDQQLYAF